MCFKEKGNINITCIFELSPGNIPHQHGISRNVSLSSDHDI